VADTYLGLKAAGSAVRHIFLARGLSRRPPRCGDRAADHCRQASPRSPPTSRQTDDSPHWFAGVVRHGGLDWWCSRGEVDGAATRRTGAVPHRLHHEDDHRHRCDAAGGTKACFAWTTTVEAARAGHGPFRRPHDRAAAVAQRRARRRGGPTEVVGAVHPGLPLAGLRPTGCPAQEVKHPAGRPVSTTPTSATPFSVRCSPRSRSRPVGSIVLTDEVLKAARDDAHERREPDRSRGRRAGAVHPWADVLLREPEHDAAAMAPRRPAMGDGGSTSRGSAGFLLGRQPVTCWRPRRSRRWAEPAGVDASSLGWSAYGLGLQVMRIEGRNFRRSWRLDAGLPGRVVRGPAEQAGAVMMTNSTSGPARRRP